MRTESETTNVIKWLRAWFWFCFAVIVLLGHFYFESLDAIDWQQGEIYRLQQQVMDMRMDCVGGEQ